MSRLDAHGAGRPRGRREPAPRLRVLAGLVLVLGAVGGVVALTSALRHPPALAPAPAPDEGSDPRDEISCPEVEELDTDVPLLVSSDDLYECPQRYDGRTVRYEGEVVGALLQRRDGVWTQLNDDAYAGDLGPLAAHRLFRGGNAGAGVLLPHELAGGVALVGGPTARGDVLEVVGTFHLSDPASREVAVIRAVSGRVVRRGEPIDHAPMRDRQVAGVVLGIAAAAALAAGRAARPR